jgi:hypothetical protein
MKRGFAFSVAAGIVFATLMAVAAFQIALSSPQAAGAEEFKIARASERWSDAAAYYNFAFIDAATDAAYLAVGCGGPWNGSVCGNLFALLPSYFSNASVKLSDQLVTINANVSLACSEASPYGGYNRTINATFALAIAANSSSVKKTGSFNALRWVDVNQSAGVFTVRIRDAGSGELMRVVVNCSV